MRRPADGGGRRRLPAGRPADHKLKKTGPEAPTQIELEPTEDVLSTLAAQRRADQVLVGFAAEHGEGAVAYGREKLERKRLDAIVINDISRADIGFDSDRQRGRDPGPRRRRASTSREAAKSEVADARPRPGGAAARSSGERSQPRQPSARPYTEDHGRRVRALQSWLSAAGRRPLSTRRRCRCVGPAGSRRRAPRSVRRWVGRCFRPSTTSEAADEFRGGRRAGADQRLRALLPGPLPADAGAPRGGAAAARAGGLHAARAQRLPRLSRPRARRGRAGRVAAATTPRSTARSSPR